MPDYPGTFIVLEGSDGSGKGTQFRLLAERLKAVGYDVELFDFPRYDQPSSHFVRRYLNGDYGPASQINPYSASLFYALDRFEAAPQIRKALTGGKIVLCNRYAGSNMAHQGSKFGNQAEQRGFFIWADSMEYQLLGIPRPNLNIYLRVPADTAYQLIGRKAQRSYTSKKRDEHEADIDHLRRSVAAYDTLCRLFPKDFQAIECTSDGQLLGIPAINDLIWHIIKPLLPSTPPRRARSKLVRLDEQDPLQQRPAPAKTAASPKETELSLLALLELAQIGGLDTQKQLLEPSLSAGNSYYQPAELTPELLKKYNTFMDQLGKTRQRINRALARDNPAFANAINARLTPMASLVALELEDTSISESSLVKKTAVETENLAELARQKLPTSLSTELEPLSLLEAWPRQEFDILSDSLYGVSDLPRRQLRASIDAWSYEQKYQALEAILNTNNSNIAHQIRYRWDVIAQQGLILELLKSGLAEDLQVQTPTPRYGYGVPGLLEKLGLDGEFIDCFDKSLELFSELQGGKNEYLAAYVTLVGHKARFQFSCNLEKLKSNAGESPILEKFKAKMIDKMVEAHPLIAAHLEGDAKKPASTPQKNPSRSPKSGRRRRSKK